MSSASMQRQGHRARRDVRLKARETRVGRGVRRRGDDAAHAEARRWLARELHDGPLQAMMALIVGLEELRGADPGPAGHAGLADTAREVVSGLRRIVYDLRSEPSDIDVAEGIGRTVESFAARTRLATRVTVPRDPVVLAAPAAVEVLRILAEALNNVVRHSGAQSVEVNMQVLDGAMVMTVSDNGRGFDPAINASGIGIRGMQERARLVRGRLTIEGGSQSGTTVRLLAPTGAAA